MFFCLSGSDNKIFIWNCGTGEPLVGIELPDLILSASFNYNGSRVAVTTKDKMIRILDPRTGSEIKVSSLDIFLLLYQSMSVVVAIRQ